MIPSSFILLFIMVSGPTAGGRCPGGVVPYLVSACLLSALLHLPEARASYYPQSGECKGKKDCTGRNCCCTSITSITSSQEPHITACSDIRASCCSCCSSITLLSSQDCLFDRNHINIPVCDLEEASHLLQPEFIVMLQRYLLDIHQTD